MGVKIDTLMYLMNVAVPIRNGDRPNCLKYKLRNGVMDMALMLKKYQPLKISMRRLIVHASIVDRQAEIRRLLQLKKKYFKLLQLLT